MKNWLSENRRKIISWTVFLVCIFIYSFLLSAICELSAHHELSELPDFLFENNVLLAVTNVALLLMLLIIVITFVTTKLSVAVAVVSIASYVLFVADGMKILFRNEPLYLWDMVIAGEAANVMGSVGLKFTTAMIAGIIFVLVGIGISVFADIKLMKIIKMKYRFNAIPALASMMLLVIIWNTIFTSKYMTAHNLHTVNWKQLDSYKENGLVYSMLSNSMKSKVTAPEGYSQESIDDIISATNIGGKEENLPNIIVFMSEAYTDIEDAQNIKYSKDIDENFDRLSEKYLSGRCLTKQFGGGTANSEFEVLTGLSSSLLPPGVIGYTNYIKSDTPTIVSFLNEKGYYSTASHPYLRNFFSRETAYESMGFAEFHSQENFENAQTCREQNYITDISLVDKIIELYEKNEPSEKPFFNHSVSMQNHSSYWANEFKGDDVVTIESDVEMTDAEKNSLQTYASGIYLSDKALGKLIEYFEGIEEPTVILYFGDHQPYLAEDTFAFMKKIGYLPENETDAQYKFYSTPYLIWNNFKEDAGNAKEDMSMFQLMPYLTDVLDMQRPDYYYFLSDYAKTSRGFTDLLQLDSEGKPTSEQTEEALQMNKEFRLLQYDILHGKKYCKEKFY